MRQGMIEEKYYVVEVLLHRHWLLKLHRLKVMLTIDFSTSW